MNSPVLRLATRGSPLALAQAHLVRLSLADVHGWEMEELDEICPILTFKTMGDRIQDRPLVEAGGKGLFVKEIEEALLNDEADIAVHSMKDMPAVHPTGLSIGAVLPREDPHDIFIARDGAPFDKLAEGAKLGTSSVRRQAQALRLRPDLKIVPLRGNVETRLLKLARGEADAIMLARAGVSRLKLALPDSEILEGVDWLPALCQGAVGIEIRNDDSVTHQLVAMVDDAETHLAIACERGFLAALDGSCRTPIAGLAEIEDGRLRFKGEVLSLDGRNIWTASRDISFDEAMGEYARTQAYSAGEDAAREIRDRAGAKLPRF
ncbi:MAG TPA: hydroxymethylbilane synthase [Micropepsaceae bacterium]|jgi:hydroxymethylbilane synthase|nr:hydroxymethylbilane synthase [Micropepsaceae bacterium]